MTKPLQKSEMLKYAKLWKAFRERNFTNSEAKGLLRENNGHNISVLFYNLKRHGWLSIVRNPSDKRKKIYRLKEPNLVIEELS